MITFQVNISNRPALTPDMFLLIFIDSDQNAATGDPQSYGADFLVVHLRPWTIPPNAGIHWPDMSTCLPAISERWGAPVYRDAEIVVFKLRS